MKTLHLTNAWHAASGGIATFYRALLDEANRRGHYIRLIVPADRHRVEDVGAYGRIYHIEAPPAPLNNRYRLLLPHRYLWPGTRIQEIIMLEQPDLIEITDKYSLPYLGGLLRHGWSPGLKKRPTVIGLTCERMDDNLRAYCNLSPALLRWSSRWYMRRIYFPLFDHHIAISRHTAGELALAARGHKVRRGVWMNGLGVDLAQFSPSRRNPQSRERLLEATGGNSDSILLLYAGRLVPEKNLPLLVETLSLLCRDRTDYRLIIAGTGILASELEAQFNARAPGKALFVGHVGDREDLANLLGNCDIFVHPNPREPFGIAPLEAMASGLPVVLPNEGGVTSYATNQNSWMAAPHGLDFAEAIRSAVVDPSGSLKRARSAQETAAVYAWENVAAEYLRLYAEIHAYTQNGCQASRQPAFVSTQGNWLGSESRS